MARLGIYTGTAPDAGDGDTLLDGAVKVNSNFIEVYTLLGDGTNLLAGIVTSIVAGNNISVSGSTGQVTVNAGAGGTWSTSASGIHTSKNVGIGTTNPTSAVTVSGDGIFTGVITATTFSGNATSSTYSSLSGIATYSSSSGIATYAVTSGVSTYSPTAGIATYAVTSGVSTSVIGGISSVTQLTVSGIATISSTLDVNGDVKVGINTSRGVILTSPDGTQYRLIVDNSGNLSTASI